MPVSKTVLPNGVCVLVDSVPHVQSASLGVWLRTGGMHDPAPRAGIAHFVEHMLFKGTARRTAHQIAQDIEGRGGQLNAFTDRQHTCYYARCLAEEAAGAFDVLSDMVTGSLMAPADVETERMVILEEIRRGEDEPDDLVHDLHFEGLWPGHPLGRPVIGTADTVGATQRDDLAGYVASRYTGDRLIVAAAGRVEADEVVRMAEQAFGSLPAGSEATPVEPPAPTPGYQYVAKDVEQVHFCIGVGTVPVHDPRLHVQIVFDNIMGSGMSSRLFQEVREKRGLAYAVGSYGVCYPEGGCFTVYGGTGSATWEELQAVVAGEFAKVADEPPGDDEVARAKRMVAGAIALGLEAMQARMVRMARNEMTFGRDVPIEETLAKIEAVTPAALQEFAAGHLAQERVRTTAIGPG